MREGFLADNSWDQEQQISRIPKCGACKLYTQCQSPKMEPSGKGRRKVLIVAEAPGRNEDEQGVQLVGEAGQILEETLEEIGVDMRKDCYLTNALICRPPKNKTPTDKQVSYCQPNLFNTIEWLEPNIIIPLGSIAVKSLIGGIWKEKVGGIQRWMGWQIPSQTLNAWICPNFHPAALIYEKRRWLEKRSRTYEVMMVLFKRYLRRAFQLEDKPWETIPDFRKAVTVVNDPSEAAKQIQTMTSATPFRTKDGIITAVRPVTFDYETDRLKPDHPDARIVCCSLSNGLHTIAFPWVGNVIKAMKEFLQSDVPKIASNMKFEHRWSKAVLGVDVKNWQWDTMQAAHLLDNRKEITSIKFQSFVRLGQPSYDDRIKPYLKAQATKKKHAGGNDPNKIHECDLQELLLYCGLDSLLEWRVAELQRKDFDYA